ncbi:carboxymuconolactone decarboxylase family protein [Kitasatospora acidiphila]|uniref:Carboxymuconolactone decarboxylase family protein n=1 Tax=Kitasatospora acidiphila TaxID=2567942 RepID=A0A540VXX2_9ACTN|nr:carboxymuconolactone decarboxylase family protein [Kitasatospora acidiphila]
MAIETTTTETTTTETAAAEATTARTVTASRLSNPVKLVPEMGAAAGALYKAVGNGSVPQGTIDLIQLRAGQIVGNTYLTALHTKSLRAAGEPEERIDAVASWQDAPYFTEAEAVALALVEAVLQPAIHGERVPDALFARAVAHYDEKALVTLALAIGQVNFFIPLALIGKPLPGLKPSEQWT